MNHHPNPKEIWPDSGLHLLDIVEGNHLGITDDFLRDYFSRPELMPVAESCDAERVLHATLMDDPCRTVSPGELSAMADQDVVENYTVILYFRDRLIAAETIEGCYLSAFSQNLEPIPFYFFNHMAQLITHNVMNSCNDPFIVRASELLFRKQAVNIHEGATLAVDLEMAKSLDHENAGFGALGKTLVQQGATLRPLDLDVMTMDNANAYWDRTQDHDIVLDLTFGRDGLDALCRAMEMWMQHLLMVGVKITPLQEINDENWVWHTGLDVDSTALLNDLYQGNQPSEDQLYKLLSLFKLEFNDTGAVLPDIAGHPVYLGLCMDAHKKLHLKPQNLLFNMPLASVIN